MDIKEVLESTNIGKEFRIESDGTRVKNVNGELLFAKMEQAWQTGCTPPSKPEIKWDKAPLNSYFVTAKYIDVGLNTGK